jgi:hypothetical protein
MIGPSRGGRVTTVAGVPREPHTFYMGSTGGGVWKTIDAGITWRNVSDGFFTEASMGALDVSASEPSIVWAGTGSEGLRSNVSTGRGAYRSLDAGKTWTHVGLREAGQIGGVRIHPGNPDGLRGGGRQRVRAEPGARRLPHARRRARPGEKVLFVSDSTGAVDVELQPGNPDVVYASMWRGERKPWTIISGAREGGIYRAPTAGPLDEAGERAPLRALRQEQHFRLGRQPQPRVRADRGGARRRPVPLGRRGGPGRWRAPTRASSPVPSTTPTSPPTPPTPTWSTWAPRASTVGRRREDVAHAAHAARRQPRPVDQPARQPRSDPVQRRRRQRDAGRRAHLEHAVQPAHRRDLPGVRGQPVPLPRLRRAAGQHHAHRPQPPHRAGLARRPGADVARRGRGARRGPSSRTPRCPTPSTARARGSSRGCRCAPGRKSSTGWARSRCTATRGAT